MKSTLEEFPELLPLIGILAARWATLDVVLVELLVKAVGNRPIAEAIYYSSSSGRLRFDLTRAVLKATSWGEEDKNHLLKLVDKLSDLWGARNDLMHSPGTYEFDRVEKHGAASARPIVKVIRPASSKPVKHVLLSEAQLQDHISRLTSVADAIVDYVHGDALRAVLASGALGEDDGS